MKLFIYDEKHQAINGEMDLSITERKKIQEILDFLDRNRITNRYKRLVIAKGYEKKWVEGEPEIVFCY